MSKLCYTTPIYPAEEIRELEMLHLQTGKQSPGRDQDGARLMDECLWSGFYYQRFSFSPIFEIVPRSVVVVVPIKKTLKMDGFLRNCFQLGPVVSVVIFEISRGLLKAI